MMIEELKFKRCTIMMKKTKNSMNVQKEGKNKRGSIIFIREIKYIP